MDRLVMPSKAWRKANPEKQRAQAARQAQRRRENGKYRENWLWRRYGITTSDYDRFVRAQSGRCAICDRPPAEGKVLPVDHDHTTGEVRGLLCTPCNTKLAVVEDDDFMERALRYLDQSAIVVT